MTDMPDVDLFAIVDAVAARQLAEQAEAEARAKEEAEAAAQARLDKIMETYGTAKGPLLVLIQRSVSISMPRTDTGDPDPTRFNPDYLEALFWVLEKFVADPDKVVAATIRRSPSNPPTRPAPTVKVAAHPRKQAVRSAPAAKASQPQQQVQPDQPADSAASVVVPDAQQRQAGPVMFDQKADQSTPQAVRSAPAAKASQPQQQVQPATPARRVIAAQPDQATTATRVLQSVNGSTSRSARPTKPARTGWQL